MYSEVDSATFKDAMAQMPEALKNVLSNYQMPMLSYDTVKCVVRSVNHDANEAPPIGYDCYLINGDLNLKEAINLSKLNAPDGDGNVIFIVTGNLTCERLVNDWGSLIAVGGNLTVNELYFAAREDSANFVIGDVDIWCYIGLDIWIETSGETNIEYGWGYTLPINYTDAANQAVYPKRSQKETLSMMGLKDSEDIFNLDMALGNEAVKSFKPK